MRAQALTREIMIDRVDLEALDKFLRSDRLPPNGMMVSELDGFLTGIAIGPELIRPSEWLPLVWGGNTPEFAGLDEANAVLGSLMVRYNEILRDVADDAFAPIFWTDRNGTVVATDWAEGFLQAIKLRPDAWKPLFTSERDGKLLFPILSLCCDESGVSLLGLPPDAEDRIVERAPELITELRHWDRRLLAPQRTEANLDVVQAWTASQIGAASPSKLAATIRVLAAPAESTKGAAPKACELPSQPARGERTLVLTRAGAGSAGELVCRAADATRPNGEA